MKTAGYRKEVHFFTAVSSEVVHTCVIYIDEVTKANNGQFFADIRKKVVLVLSKFNLNISFVCLSVMFDYSPWSCTKYFYAVLYLLALEMKPVVYWPTKDAILAIMPKCFDKYKNTRFVLDCTEIKVQNGNVWNVESEHILTIR